MTGWHFHWSIAPVIFLAGLAAGVIFAPTGTTAAPTPAPIAVAVEGLDIALPAGEVSADVADETPNGEGSMYRTHIPPAVIEAGADRAHNAAMAEIERFRRKNYEDCVAKDLIGDNCRIIFYPETPAEKAQSQQWQRQARPAVEAQTRWLSEYQEEQIRENSR